MEEGNMIRALEYALVGAEIKTYDEGDVTLFWKNNNQI